MFIKLLQDVGAWPKDSIQRVDRAIAEGFLKIGQAVEVDEMEYLGASMRTMADTNKADTLGAVRKMMEEMFAARDTPVVNGKKPTPPGGGINFNDLNGGSTPAHEQDKNLNLGDAMRCLFFASARGAPFEKAQYAQRRLASYMEDVVEYTKDEHGNPVETFSRQIPGGGIETVIRTGTDSLGGGATYGFTLKPNYVDNLFRIAAEAQVFANGTRSVPITQGNETIWPLLNQFSAPTTINGIPQSAVYGGVQLYYAGETTPRTLTDASVRENRFKLLDLTAMTSFSRDYIVDNFIAMDSEVSRIFGEAMGWVKDWVYIQGNGVGQPQGYLNSKAAISITRGTTNLIQGVDLVTMMSQFATMYWKKGRWLANVTTLPQLYVVTYGGASAVPLFQPNALISQDMILSIMAGSKVDEAKLISAPMGTLLGMPIYFTEKLPTLGHTGDICLVAPDAYGDATRGGIEMAVSEHYAFNVDEIYYRAKMRHFGRSLWPAPYQQADGSTTNISPFTYLHS